MSRNYVKRFVNFIIGMPNCPYCKSDRTLEITEDKEFACLDCKRTWTYFRNGKVMDL
jgi:transposase-like protein